MKELMLTNLKSCPFTNVSLGGIFFLCLFFFFDLGISHSSGWTGTKPGRGGNSLINKSHGMHATSCAMGPVSSAQAVLVVPTLLLVTLH
jgi:hypothetical protein